MLFWLWMTLTITQAQEASGCLTPRDAGASLVENLQTDHWKPALAAACLDTRRGAEAREKLANLRPATLGAAARIAGINPPDVALVALEVARLGAKG